MARTRSAETSFPVPLEIVGSSSFGRVPKISDEYTFNMIIEDDALINFAGYQFRTDLLGNGRGIFASEKANLMFAVSENYLYTVSPSLLKNQIVSLHTSEGDVVIDEDILNNIAICDRANIYIYNYETELNYIAGTAPYNTGTVSQTGNAITGIGTTFTADMVGGNIYFPDNTIATITAFLSTTSLTVSVPAERVAGDYLITQLLDFVPNYVCFHDGRFIVTSSSSGGNKIGQWRLSTTVLVPGGATYVVFPATSQFQGGFQTKPDLPIGVVRLPGRANQIIVFGSTVAEPWSDQGLAKFPYEKNRSFNIDFGCLNPSTIATLNNLVIWIGRNERSGLTIMYTTGQDAKKISTSGIDNLLERIDFPEECYGYIYMQSGHMFYIFTFTNPADNLTLAYDFSTGKFYNLTDEHLNFHIAKKIVFFNNKYYFISIVDGNIYEISSEFTQYQYKDDVNHQIPRSRVLPTYRTPDDVPYVANDLFFIVEQGIDSENTGQGNNIDSLEIVSGGTGFTTCSLLIEGDGTGAHATATLTAGVITSVTLDEPGIGYSWGVVTAIGDGVGADIQSNLNVNGYVPRVDISASFDGGYSWSNFDVMALTTYGKFKNRFYYNGLGSGNEFTFQFRIHCNSRFVCKNGSMSLYR